MHLLYKSSEYDFGIYARELGIGNDEFMEYLIDLGANPLIRNASGELPLDIADDSQSKSLLERYVTQYEAGVIGKTIGIPTFQKSGVFKL